MILRIAGQSSSLAESAGASNNTSDERGLRVQQEYSASSGEALLSSVTNRTPYRPAWRNISNALSLILASSSGECRGHHTGCLQPLYLLYIRQSRRGGWAYSLSKIARGYDDSSAVRKKPLGSPSDRQVNQRGSHPLSPEGGNSSNERKCALESK